MPNGTELSDIDVLVDTGSEPDLVDSKFAQLLWQNQAPTRIQVYSCIYDEYKGFILYLYLQVTTDFVLTIIGTTCHFLVADFSSVRHPLYPPLFPVIPGLSFGTSFFSQDFRSQPILNRQCRNRSAHQPLKSS